MARPILSALLGILLTTTMALAQFKDGNEIYAHCQEDRSVVAGYVMGIADALLLSEQIYASNKFSMCIPKGVLASQVVDVTCNYLRDHPQNRQYDAASLVNLAITAAWPCGTN